MILSDWFDYLGESFSYREVHFELSCLPVKTSHLPAENSNETVEFEREGSKEFYFVYLKLTYLIFITENLLRFKLVIHVHVAVHDLCRYTILTCITS